MKASKILTVASLVAAMATSVLASPNVDYPTRQDAHPAVLTNHSAAVAYLKGIKDRLGDQFTTTDFHGIDTRPLTTYIAANPSDTVLFTSTVELAKEWANLEKVNAELRNRQDNPTVNHRAWHRTMFSWHILFSYGVLSNNMNYVDAVAILGRPRGHPESTTNAASVIWGEEHSLIIQTWIEGSVSTNGLLTIEGKRTN